MLASERYTALLEALDSPDIDLADIAALKLVSVTRNKIGTRVICLTQDVLPAEVEIDRVLMWLVRSLDQVVAEPFITVFFNARQQHNFSMGWLWQTYQMLHHKYRENLQRLYFVHPSAASKLAFRMIAPFIAEQDMQKVHWVSSLSQLQQLLGCPELPIPDSVTERDTTPSQSAVREVAQQLSAHGIEGPPVAAAINCNVPLTATDRRLLVAATMGDLQQLQTQLSSDAKLNARDGCGLTALMLAARGGKADIVKELLEASCEVNAANAEGATAVQLASQYGHEDIVGLLIASGARPNSDAASESALAAAAGTGQAGVVSALLKHGSSITERGQALLKACDYGDPLVVKQLLSSRVSNTQRGSALVRAAELGHADLVVLLLEHAAEFNLLDSSGHSALMRASMLGHNQVVGVLLIAKADLELTNRNKSSALHLAAQLNNTDAVSQLVTAKSDLEAADEYQLTPLMLASDGGFKSIVDILVNAKADVSAKDNHGMDALMLASSFGHQQVVDQLVLAGASQDDLDEEGRNAAAFAKMHKNASL